MKITLTILFVTCFLERSNFVFTLSDIGDNIVVFIK